jgi:hypothetical protein
MSDFYEITQKAPKVESSPGAYFYYDGTYSKGIPVVKSPEVVPEKSTTPEVVPEKSTTPEVVPESVFARIQNFYTAVFYGSPSVGRVPIIDENEVETDFEGPEITYTEVLSQANSLTQAISRWFSEVFARIQKFFNETEVFARIQKNFNEVFARIQKFSNEVFARIQKFSNEVFVRIQKFSNEVFVRIQKFSNEVFVRIQKFSNEVFARVQKFLNEVFPERIMEPDVEPDILPKIPPDVKPEVDTKIPPAVEPEVDPEYYAPLFSERADCEEFMKRHLKPEFGEPVRIYAVMTELPTPTLKEQPHSKLPEFGVIHERGKFENFRNGIKAKIYKMGQFGRLLLSEPPDETY